MFSQQEFSSLTENTDDYDFVDQSEAGYSNSLREVAVKLENSGAFKKLKPLQLLGFCNANADADLEEQLLKKIRNTSK